MKTLLHCSVLFLLAAVSGLASLIPINTDVVKKAVVFLYATTSAGQPDTSKELATGFLIEIPKKNDPSQSYVALVTARHVVDPMWACVGTEIPKLIYARVNRKQYDASRDASGVEFLPIPLVVDGKAVWTKHSTDTVDAVLVPVAASKFLENDIAVIKVREFGTSTEIKGVGIGDEIISAGLVPGLSGKKRNYPFFKFGRVSNIPDEQGFIPCHGDTKPLEYWYIAATLIGGNSGSPIFFLPPGNAVISFARSTTPTRTFLLGLQSMSLQAGEIAGMTPVERIFEIIESLKLPDADLFRGPLPNPPPPAPTKK